MRWMKEKQKTERSREISSSNEKKRKGKDGKSSVPGLELLCCMNDCTPLLHLPFFPSLSPLALSSIIQPSQKVGSLPLHERGECPFCVLFPFLSSLPIPLLPYICGIYDDVVHLLII